MAKTDSTRDFYVYAHFKSTDGSCFYVGKGHGRRAWDKKGRNPHWNHIVAKHGYTVEIVQSGMLEWWAFEMEIELISFYGRKNLANLTDGGDGPSGYKATKEAKAKLSVINTGKKLSVETCNKMSNSRTGLKHTKLTKKRMSDSAKNRSPEHLLKISIAQKGIPKSKESIEKSRLSRIGKKQTASHKKLISDALKKSSKKTPVICIDLNIKFLSLLDAELWLKNNGHLKASSSGIHFSMKKNGRKAYGYHWKYA